jgi:hypothetical protein
MSGCGLGGHGNRRRVSWLNPRCAIFAEIICEMEDTHIAAVSRDVQGIGKSRTKTTDRPSRDVRLFILPSFGCFPAFPLCSTLTTKAFSAAR